MKRSEVYLRAAEIMDDPEHLFHACHAIAKAINGLPPDHFGCGNLGDEYNRRKEEFKAWFEPEAGSIWYWPRKDRKSRVIALCLMAAIADYRNPSK